MNLPVSFKSPPSTNTLIGKEIAPRLFPDEEVDVLLRKSDPITRKIFTAWVRGFFIHPYSYFTRDAAGKRKEHVVKFKDERAHSRHYIPLYRKGEYGKGIPCCHPIENVRLHEDSALTFAQFFN